MQAPENKQEADLPPLPTFDSGGAFVDVADRDALYKVMEEWSANSKRRSGRIMDR